MVKLICGKKGSGKTKRILDMANAAQQDSTGSVVFIDDDNKYMYDLHHQIRFINVNDFHIKNANVLEGVIIGLLAGNYDMQTIFIDGLLRILPDKIDELGDFIKDLNALSQAANVDIILTVSGDQKEMPAFVQQFAI